MILKDRQRALVGILAAAMAMTAFGGCSSAASSAESSASESTSAVVSQAEEVSEVETSTEETAETAAENTFAYTDETMEAPVSTTLTASVSGVDGNEITLTIGGGMSGGAMDAPGGDGEAMEMPGEGGEAMELPDGEGGEAMELPDGEGGEAMELPEGESGETMEMPEGEGGETMELPEGEGGEAMEMPDGEGGESMEMPDGDSEAVTALLTIGDESVITVTGDDGEAAEGSLADITEGVMLEITFDDAGAVTAIAVSAGMGGMDSMMGGSPGGQSSGVDSYTAVNEYTEDTTVDGESISSTGTDENAVLVSGDAQVTLRDVIVDRTSGDSTGGDNSSFYGVGAAILGTNGSTYISGSTITTDAAGGAGVFAYGDGTVYVADTEITTVQNTSGGIHAAGGGTLYAWQLTVTTNGESAAAIRSDRGGAPWWWTAAATPATASALLRCTALRTSR